MNIMTQEETHIGDLVRPIHASGEPSKLVCFKVDHVDNKGVWTNGLVYRQWVKAEDGAVVTKLRHQMTPDEWKSYAKINFGVDFDNMKFT